MLQIRRKPGETIIIGEGPDRVRLELMGTRGRRAILSVRAQRAREEDLVLEVSGRRVAIKVCGIGIGEVELGIDAPPDLAIVRGELGPRPAQSTRDPG